MVSLAHELGCEAPATPNASIGEVSGHSARAHMSEVCLTGAFTWGVRDVTRPNPWRALGQHAVLAALPGPREGWLGQ